MCQRVVRLDIPPQDRSTFTSLMTRIANRTTSPPPSHTFPTFPPPPPAPPQPPPPPFSCRKLGLFCEHPPPSPSTPPAPPALPPRTPASQLFAVREAHFRDFGAYPEVSKIFRIDLTFFFILFTILVSTLHDFVRGVRCFLRGYLVCGALHISLSLAMSFTAETISAGSCTTLDAIKDSVRRFGVALPALLAARTRRAA